MGKVADRNVLVHKDGTNESLRVNAGEPFPEGTDEEIVDRFGIDEKDYEPASDGVERDENGAAEGHPTLSPERTLETVGPDDSGATTDAPHRDAADSTANDPTSGIGGKGGGESIVAGHGDGEDEGSSRRSRSRSSSSDDE